MIENRTPVTSLDIKYNEDALSFKQAILDSTSHLVIATDLNGTITFFNTAAQKSLGYSSEEIVGKQTPALWHDAKEVVKKAEELSKELGRTIEPGFHTFIAKALLDIVDTS